MIIIVIRRFFNRLFFVKLNLRIKSYIILLYGIVIINLLDISYNPFLWILFAETGKKRKQKKISGAEKNI